MLVAVVAVVALVAVLLVTAGEAEAWAGTSKYSDDDENKAGYVRYHYEWSNSYGVYYNYYKHSTDPRLEYDYYSGSTYWWYFYDRGWLSIPISDFDVRTHVEAATIYINVRGEYNYDDYMYVRLCRFDAMAASARSLYDDMSRSSTSYTVGYSYVDRTGTYSLSITGSALTYVRDAVANGDDYIHFGLYGSSSRDDYIIIDADRSYVYFLYDEHAPNSPSMNAISTYTKGTSVTVSWTQPSDNPTSPNSGLAYWCYEVGVFESAQSFVPSSTVALVRYDYLQWTFHDLQDGKKYWFRVQARDTNGFISVWSNPASTTTMDASPPTVPILKQEPLYTSGTSNVIEWLASADAGIGVDYYQVQRATNPDFTGASTGTTSATQYTFSSLSTGSTYYYRARSVDYFGHFSEWGVPQMSTQDSSPPSVPVLLEEPLYTQGTENTFSWHPSSDEGIGLSHYEVQVARSPGFGSGTVILDQSTTKTFATVTNLRHQTTYHARVRAVDSFGYRSGWSALESSTQDDVGPEAPLIHQLPEYHPAEPVVLTWDPPEDSGIGVVGWYKVMWNNMSDWSGMGDQRDFLLGNRYAVPGLDAGETWYFRVMAYDSLGNAGSHHENSTTVDGMAPTAPVLASEPEYTAGTENTVTWQASTDDLSGVDHYVVRVFAMAGGTGLVFTDATSVTSMTVPGLADGATYWYLVTAVDGAGNTNSGALEHSTQDASPPAVPLMMSTPPRHTAGTTVSLEWFASHDGGSGGVEYEVEWATDADFTTGVGSSGWMPGTSYDVEDLVDGTTYHLRLKARDALGLESPYGPVSTTEMDASPPPVPVMDDLEPFVPGPEVMVGWEPVSDASGLPVEYMMLVYDAEDAGATPVETFPYGEGVSRACRGLPCDTMLYIRVVARDALGWESEVSDAVTCTIDCTGPEAAVLDGLPGNSPGTGLVLAWSPAEDAGIGQVMHRLVVFSDEELTSRVFVTEWSMVAEAEVFGLADGRTYWFAVECRDGFGNPGAASTAEHTTMDASPPEVTVDAPGVFGPLDGGVSGTVTDGVSGTSSVEVSGDGGENWLSATMDGVRGETRTWTVDFSDLPVGATEVWVRATDQVGNVQLDHAMAHVDRVAPEITITLPTGGSEVSGAVTVIGTVSDAHLASYVVEAQKEGEGAWTTVQPTTATAGVSGTLATWVTSGMTGGEYTLRVTATDTLSNSGSAQVTVTLKGAHLTIGTGDISFSDSHPLPGDTVTVFVTVRNEGDSPAENVQVTVMDKGREVGSETVTVPAHGTTVVPVKLKVSGSHELTARASSPLYDTGAMSTGQPLQTIEEEKALEDSGGILGLLALIVAIIAILLVLVMGRRGGAAPSEPEPLAGDDVLVDPLEEDLSASEPEPLPSPVPPEEEAGRPRTHMRR